MKNSQIDNELCMRHEGGRLTVLITKHVDDLKTTGQAERVKTVLSELQRVFGELKVEWYVFTNCGVKHVQDQVTKEVTLDQIAYVGNLRAISHPQLTDGKEEDFCTPDLH